MNPGDGGLCVIPGSHKANFTLPDAISRYEAAQDIVYHVPMKAGDLVIFNEATTHGTLPWKGKGRAPLAVLPVHAEVHALQRRRVRNRPAGVDE